MRARVTVLLLMLPLVVGGCSTKKPTRSAAHTTKGPILNVTVGQALDAKGAIVRPSFAYDARVKQIVVAAQLGKTGATVDFTWSRIPDLGQPQTLFTHSVNAPPHAQAFSTGKNPGTLAEGTYGVEVSAQGQTSTLVFDVMKSTSNDAAASPASGASGTAPHAPGVPASPGIDTPLIAASWTDDPDLTASSAVFIAVGSTTQAADVLSVRYGANGSLTREATFRSGSELSVDLDPCTLAGGSDLPGARLDLRAAVLRNGKQIAGGSATSSDSTTLGPDTSLPHVKGDTTPKAGSKVRKGSKIAINLFGEETRDGGSWQTGVQNVQIIADGVLIDTAEAKSKIPKKCDEKQWKLTFDHAVEYEVPQNAKPSFEICAIVQDFKGNTKRACGTYYTAEVWKGPVTGQTRQPGCSPATTNVTGSLQVNVGDSGAITGSDTEARGSYTCGGVTAPAYSKTFNNVTGTKTETAFNLVISGKKLTIPISGNSATKTVVMNGAGGYGATTTYTLTCQDCA